MLLLCDTGRAKGTSQISCKGNTCQPPGVVTCSYGTPLLTGSRLSQRGFHHLWDVSFFEDSRPSPSLAAVDFTGPPAAKNTTHQFCEGLPSSSFPASPHPTPQTLASVVQPASCQAVSQSLPGFIGCVATLFLKKSQYAVPGPGQTDPASANCQLSSISLIPPWGSQVIPLHVSHQTPATGTLQRQGQQNSRLPRNQGLALSGALKFGCKGLWSCLPFLDKGNYFPYKHS